MIEAICINDKNKPKEIPQSKWLIEGNKYHITYTITCLPQRVIGVYLDEIDLTENEAPYEFFMLSRFAIKEEDLAKLLQLIKDCSDTDFSLADLIKQTELQEA